MTGTELTRQRRRMARRIRQTVALRRLSRAADGASAPEAHDPVDPAEA